MSLRTGHSLGGMRRYMQMSQTRVFIFVEGRDLDPDVYSRLCAPLCSTATKSYEIVIADRVIGGGGGKNVLTRLFEYLGSCDALLDRTQPETKLTLFYLDKDVDELFRALRASDHVVYTRYYSIENHIFAEGSLIASLATAGSLDLQVIQARISDGNVWRAKAAELWRDWTSLCLLARKLRLPRPASYTFEKSMVNAPEDSPVDPTLLQRYISEMESLSGLSSDEFQRHLTAARRLVNSIYQRSQHDMLFKGKWYLAFARRELDIASGGTPYNRNGAADRLFGSLIASTDFDASWSEHFRQPLRLALSRM